MSPLNIGLIPRVYYIIFILYTIMLYALHFDSITVFAYLIIIYKYDKLNIILINQFNW